MDIPVDTGPLVIERRPTPPDAAGVDAPVVSDFESLYVSHRPPMVRLARLILGDLAAAEDVVQESFAVVYERWPRLDQPGGYLRTTVVNRSRDVLRRRRVAERLRLRERIVEPPGEPLADALGRLAPGPRAAVVLRFYEDLSVDQIAEVLGTRPGTVKSWLHRGLAALREDLR